MPGKQRATLLLLAALAAVAAIVLIPILTDEDELQEDTPTPAQTATTTPATTSTTAGRPTPRRPAEKTIRVRDGEPVGGVQRLSYDSGETVSFVVISDTAEEVHVHGYDIEKALPAGRRARVRFEARLEGIYEVELHGSGQQIAELRVR